MWDIIFSTKEGKKYLIFFKSRDKNCGIHLGKYGYYYFPIILLWIFATFILSLYGYNKGNIYWGGIVIFIILSIPILTIFTNIINYLFSKKTYI